MRLDLETRLRPLQKIVLAMMRAVVGPGVGPAIAASYNKPYFGNVWASCLKEGMRGATEWTVAEVELFAAFVSRVNACGY